MPASVLSLLLSAATVVLGVVTRDRSWALGHVGPRKTYQLVSGFGELTVGVYPQNFGLSIWFSERSFAGVTLMTQRDDDGLGISVSFPHHYAVVVLLGLPLIWIITARGRRIRARVEAGLCRRCNYDLRATPDRCPECGTPVRPAPAASPRA